MIENVKVEYDRIKAKNVLSEIEKRENNLCICIGLACAVIAIFISFSYPFFRDILKLLWEATSNVLAIILLFVPWGLMTLAIAGISIASAIVGITIGVMFGDVISYFIYYKNNPYLLNSDKNVKKM